MKKTISIVLVLVLGLVTVSLAAEDTWTSKADMPVATSLHAAGVVDGKIYVIGGTDNLFGWADYWATVLVYDPATDTWTEKADMPTGRARLSTSVVDGKIYAIGGSPRRDSEVSTVEMYDPATDTWTMKADMPRARNWHTSSVVNGKIYVIGGKIYPSETMVSTVEEYDPATDTWTRKTEMPTARGMHSASVVYGKIYVIGGVTGNFGPWVSTMEEYDPVTDTWTKKADMPTAKTTHSSGALNGKIYVTGGANNWGYCLSMVEVYEPATDTWTKGLDMPTARGCFSMSVVNGKIYGIGGTLNPSSWMPTSTVEVYDPGLTVPSPDFNGDGIVDAADMCIMVDHWGEDYPLCDIAPPPFGDDIIDVHDLIVLAEHLFEVYPSAETVDVNEADDGGQIELELGKLLVVTLESNPSTGYRWELLENSESILKQFGQAEFRPSETGDPPMVGAGGWEIFRFKAVSAGQMTLELVYHRSWEDAEPLKAFSIQVIVN